MKELLKHLVVLADKLDCKGLKKEADTIDLILRVVAKDPIAIMEQNIRNNIGKLETMIDNPRDISERGISKEWILDSEKMVEEARKMKLPESLIKELEKKITDARKASNFEKIPDKLKSVIEKVKALTPERIKVPATQEWLEQAMAVAKKNKNLPGYQELLTETQKALEKVKVTASRTLSRHIRQKVATDLEETMDMAMKTGKKCSNPDNCLGKKSALEAMREGGISEAKEEHCPSCVNWAYNQIGKKK